MGWMLCLQLGVEPVARLSVACRSRVGWWTTCADMWYMRVCIVRPAAGS